VSETTPRMTNLFRQLGLDSDERAIAEFIRTHQLAADTRIADAAFWNIAQRQFITEYLNADGLWSTILDQLNESLHEDAVKALSGLNKT